MKGLGAVIFLSIILTCGGCGGEPAKSTKVLVPPAGKQPITSPKTPPPLTADVKVEPPPLMTYVYDPKGKPDPFKPLIVERPEVPLSKKVSEKSF